LPTIEQNASLRTLPSVDALARLVSDGGQADARAIGAARFVLGDTRAEVRRGCPAPTNDQLAVRVREQLKLREHAHLQLIINATGVLLNTNLGRAPLSVAALDAMRSVAAGYSNLEYDLEEGERGSRQSHVRALIAELTGAEDALVVNNNASAVLVVLGALAAGRDVIVSRGELVEIGGGFRVPDVLRQSGARLIEVGTTNRTRVGDYAAALSDETALLLSVHPSNFRIMGFTESPPLAALAALAHQHALPLVHDLGSGCFLATEHWGLAHEPTPHESIAAGVDIVCFSGDKLLGGPQAGILAGRRDLLERIARHPLMRAVRIDKLTLAALEATLRHYRDGDAVRTIPLWRAVAMPLSELEERAVRWALHARSLGFIAETAEDRSWIGGGSLPGEALPTVVTRLHANTMGGQLPAEALEAGELAKRLRRADPPVVARVSHGRVLLDPRSVLPEQDETLLDALVFVAGQSRDS
jgi:L-seryl-tRNA(Ser) seleniumtransferase